jgi:hypothetical protein
MLESTAGKNAGTAQSVSQKDSRLYDNGSGWSTKIRQYNKLAGKLSSMDAQGI